MTMLGAAALAVFPPQAEACTRAVYLGPDGMTATGRTMDWREDPLTNLYIFPRGTARRGANTDNTVFWTSKYGTLSAAGYDIGITDGMNEAGLVANLLFLPESVYERPGDTRPVMGLSIWTQYVLDNFATVDEAVAELEKEAFRIDAPDLPNGVKSRLHLAISDASGDSAIFEYRDGKLEIHHGRQYQVMTNSPFYADQLAILGYWQQIGGAHDAAGNQPRFGPFRAGVVLYQCRRAVGRSEDRRAGRDVGHAQRFGALRRFDARQTAHRLDALAHGLRPEEPGLLLRTDAGDGDFLDRPRGDRLFEGQRRADPYARRRTELRGRRHGEIPQERQAFRVPLRGVISSVRNEKPRL